MKFKDLMKYIQLNTQIEIYYDKCIFINEGTAEQIKRMYAWEWFFMNKEIESITINEESKALMITIKEDTK